MMIAVPSRRQEPHRFGDQLLRRFLPPVSRGGHAVTKLHPSITMSADPSGSGTERLSASARDTFRKHGEIDRRPVQHVARPVKGHDAPRQRRHDPRHAAGSRAELDHRRALEIDDLPQGGRKVTLRVLPHHKLVVFIGAVVVDRSEPISCPRLIAHRSLSFSTSTQVMSFTFVPSAP